jgi:hypothetical protein
VRQHSTVLVPIGGVHRAVLQAVEYARSLSDDVRALFVDTDAAATEKVKKDWEHWGEGPGSKCCRRRTGR